VEGPREKFVGDSTSSIFKPGIHWGRTFPSEDSAVGREEQKGDFLERLRWLKRGNGIPEEWRAKLAVAGQSGIVHRREGECVLSRERCEQEI
jgi:hypothetical protein